MTHDRWCGVNILSKFQLSISNCLGFIMLWILGGKGWLTHSLNYFIREGGEKTHWICDHKHTWQGGGPGVYSIQFGRGPIKDSNCLNNSFITDFQCLSRSEIGQQLSFKSSVWAHFYKFFPKTNRFSSLVTKPLRKIFLEDIFQLLQVFGTNLDSK